MNYDEIIKLFVIVLIAFLIIKLFWQEIKESIAFHWGTTSRIAKIRVIGYVGVLITAILFSKVTFMVFKSTKLDLTTKTNFLGSILSGFISGGMTLGGVLLTISKQSRNTRSHFESDYRSILIRIMMALEDFSHEIRFVEKEIRAKEPDSIMAKVFLENLSELIEYIKSQEEHLGKRAPVVYDTLKFFLHSAGRFKERYDDVGKVALGQIDKPFLVEAKKVIKELKTAKKLFMDTMDLT